MPKKLNITEEQVVALYQELSSIKRVAEHLGCCQRTVVNYMNSAGVQRTHHSGPRPWVKSWNKLDLDEQEVIRTYKEVHSLQKTANAFGCSSPVIGGILRKHNIPRDGYCVPDAKRRKQSSETLKKLHAAGKLRGENHWNWQGGKQTVVCGICGKEIKRWPGYPSKRPVCSKECNAKRASEDLRGEKSYMWKGDELLIKCLNCGKEFRRYGMRRSRKFCSQVCNAEYRRGSKHPSWKGGIPERVCINCGKTFRKRRNKGQTYYFCTYSCAMEFLQGEKNLKWKADAHMEVACEECGKKLTRRKDSKSRRFFCSFECARKGQTGEKSPIWVDEPKDYPAKFSRELKELIRERDGHKCQLCGKTQKQNRRRLSVHHIDYDKMNLDPKNLLALCSSCHTKTTHRRPFYQKLLEKKVG